MGKFDLKVKLMKKEEHWNKHSSKAQCKVARQKQTRKQIQIDEALEWCIENNKRGWAAKATGLFPLIRDVKTINRRLDGLVKNQQEKDYCSILTDDEEHQIVDFIKKRTDVYKV